MNGSCLARGRGQRAHQPVAGYIRPDAGPGARRAVDVELAVERLDAVREPSDPAAAARVRAADAVVGDLDEQVAVLDAATRTVAADARAYLATFVSASATR